MNIVVIGVNHKTAPVALREKLSFPAAELPERLNALKSLSTVQECVVLSTCNRVEIYLSSRQPDVTQPEVADWMAMARAMETQALTPHLYAHVGEAAIQHGFRVASSLDSLVVGEPQILGQMKEAYRLAVEAGTTGLILNKFFHRAFQVAKRVRSETTIAENPVSVAFAAVEMARRIFGRLDGHVCLLIGAGEMCELAARHLVSNGIRQVLVTNRTFERARTLADAFQGEAIPMSQLEENLHRADIVISSTGSPTHVVTASMVRKALKQRRQHPMFFIDIAVPRDLDPEIAQVDSAFLYDIDDLTQIVEKNRQDRGQAAHQAEAIVSGEIPRFSQWMGSLDVVPTIVALRRKYEAIRDQELARMAGNKAGVSAEEYRRLEELARLLVNKFLHEPMSVLRTLSVQEDGDLYVDAARKLFKLE